MHCSICSKLSDCQLFYRARLLLIVICLVLQTSDEWMSLFCRFRFFATHYFDVDFVHIFFRRLFFLFVCCKSGVKMFVFRHHTFFNLFIRRNHPYIQLCMVICKAIPSEALYINLLFARKLTAHE